MNRAPLIVLYGPNNLGKSTQVNLLANGLKDKGIFVEAIKYPIYDLEPTGPRLNFIVRGGNKFPEEDVQREYAQNRRDFEPILTTQLESGIWIIAEDYTGTGIAWGITNGLTLEKLEELNAGLMREDFAILLDGERFTSGIERQHRYEVDSDWERARQIHLGLAKRNNWEVINANQYQEKVTSDIMKLVENRFF